MTNANAKIKKRKYMNIRAHTKRFSIYRAVKSCSHLPKKGFLIVFNDSPSKMMKNAFYFILKALFVLKMFKFLSGHF